MQNKTRGWEPSVEKMTVRDGTLKGHVAMFLKLEGGGNYRCDYETTYKYVAIEGVKISQFY